VFETGASRGFALDLPDGVVSLADREGAWTLVSLGSSDAVVTVSVAGDTVIATRSRDTGDLRLNGSPLARGQVMSPGDRLSSDEASGRLEKFGTNGPPLGPASVRLGDVDAGSVNVAGRDILIQQQIESQWKAAAAAKTKGRVLVWTAILLFTVGVGGFAASMISGMIKMSGGDRICDPARQTKNCVEALYFLFGPRIYGTEVRIGMVFMLVVLIAGVLLVAGIIMHFTASARNSQADRLALRHSLDPRVYRAS
jgi:hypothetical protein